MPQKKSAALSPVGQKIKKVRLEKGMSQGDIYRSTGMDRAYLSSLENGKRNPTLSNIKKIAEAGADYIVVGSYLFRNKKVK